MESCGQAEDPDSRDSGISLAQSTNSQHSCSQVTLQLATTAIGRVDICGDSNEDENYDHFDVGNTIEEATFQRRFADFSPLKKRQRTACTRVRNRPPTDFSFLHRPKSNKEDEETVRWSSSHTALASSKSNENWLSPIPFSLSQDSHLLFASTTSSTATTSTTSSSAENDIPVSLRSIHRVHSSSVLEYSRNRSWGSPESFEHYHLITVERPQVPHRAFRSIDANTLAILLEKLTNEQFNKRFILIDCRYPYEFDGGHILHSVNMWEEKSILDVFYPNEEEKFDEIKARIPIFYCEYSQKRGPKMALSLREYDRSRNEIRYPYVDYQEIYLLDRGYRHFFKERQFTQYCTPQGYVQMWDSAFTAQRKCYDSHRRVRKRRRD